MVACPLLLLNYILNY